ncbi:hypothetical protein [Streptomyces sp. NPDC003635]
MKDHRQESLIGQAGEIEPVHDTYCPATPPGPPTGRIRLGWTLAGRRPSDRHLYIAPGVRPHRVPGGERIGVDAAPTEAPAWVRFVCPCAFGEVRSVSADGRELPVRSGTCGCRLGRGGSG